MTQSLLRFKNVYIAFNEPLGSGAYGSVYKAKCDHLPCAAKILHPMFLNSTDPAVKDTIDRFHQECVLLSSLQHPCLVQFLGEYHDPVRGCTALLMELMDESLTCFLDRHDPDSHPVPAHCQIDICHDVALALHFLHNNGIIHRDLSSNNILLKGDCRAKITDLGVSKLRDAQQRMTQCPGSPIYMPPEALNQLPVYSEKLDCFSFGVLIIQILTCRFPEPDTHEVLVADAASPTGFVRMPVKEVDRRAKQLGIIPPNHFLRPLAIRCIEDMPTKRPSSSDLCQHLEKLKLMPIYTQSKQDTNQQLENDSTSIPNMSTSIIKEKTTEIEMLKNDIRTYKEKLSANEETMQTQLIELEEAKANQQMIGQLEEMLKEHEALIKTKDEELQKEIEKSKELETKLDELKEILSQPPPENEETLNDKDETSETITSSSKQTRFTDQVSRDPNKKVITGLNPDLVALLSKSKLGELSGVTYCDPEPGCVTIISTPMESLPNRATRVVGVYRQLANQPSCLEFVRIPPNCPPEEIEHKLTQYNQTYPFCSFTYLEDLEVIQIVSTNSQMMNQAKLQMESEMNLTIFMSGRKLCLKKADITKENVVVIVNAANRRLSHNGGLSKAINIASNNKMQELCDEWVRKHGFLDECGLMSTHSGGSLKCRWVIHAVGPDGNKYTQNVLQQKMIKLITDCLVKADKLGCASIAIPPIATGHYNVNRKLAANAFITAILDYDYLHDDTLREINICIIDEKTFSEFVEVFSERRAELIQMHTGDYSREFSDSSIAPATTSSGCKTQ